MSSSFLLKKRWLKVPFWTRFWKVWAFMRYGRFPQGQPRLQPWFDHKQFGQHGVWILIESDMPSFQVGSNYIWVYWFKVIQQLIFGLPVKVFSYEVNHTMYSGDSASLFRHSLTRQPRKDIYLGSCYVNNMTFVTVPGFQMPKVLFEYKR